MKILLICCSFLFAIPCCFAAEGTEVFGVVGFSRLQNDESSLGAGFDLGAGVGFRANDRIGVTFEVDHASASRDFTSGVRFEGDATTFGGNFQIYFTGENFEPYIFAGAGITHFEETSEFPDGAIFESTDNAFTLQFGAGVRFSLNSRVSLRPEFRWSWNDISFANQIRGSVAVGYIW